MSCLNKGQERDAEKNHTDADTDTQKEGHECNIHRFTYSYTQKHEHKHTAMNISAHRFTHVGWVI